MSITTYDELKQAIANFAERGDLETMIPDFVTLAETRFSRALDHPGMSVRATATVDTASAEPEFIDLPHDFQEMRRLYLKSVAGHPALSFFSEGQLMFEKARWGGARSRPTHYTVFGTELELCPVPDSNYELEMVYRQGIDVLTDLNTTNWLLTLAPDVYLYGSLYHLAQFTGEEDKMNRWNACYQQAMADLWKHGFDMKFNASPMAITVAGENTP